MIKELMHDPIFLAGKSEMATKDDLRVVQDLPDTLIAHKESCAVSDLGTATAHKDLHRPDGTDHSA